MCADARHQRGWTSRHQHGRVVIWCATGPARHDPCGKVLNDGAWHMVAATFGAGQLRLYVDGNLDSPAVVRVYATTGQTNYIGRSNHVFNDTCCHRPFNGSIDDVAIFDRALTAAEIAELASSE